MPGFRILYVPPHLIGPITNWSGLGASDKCSWLIKRAEEMNFNAIWFSPMHQTSQVEKNFHGQKTSGSLYAIRNHFALDQEFSSGSDSKDIKHYRHFVATAKKKGLTVFADLVFNHVAADHPLVKGEEQLLQKIQTGGPWTTVYGGADGRESIGIEYEENGKAKTYYFLFKHDVRGDGQGREWLTRRICGPADDPWSDVAQINYDSPAARDFFLTGKNAYWKKQINWYMDTIGITAFRCDAAYMLPPDSWQALVNHARAKSPDAFFMAETLGGPDDKVAGLAQAHSTEKKGIGKKGQDRPAFDLGMIANYWWNFTDRWLPDQESPRLNKMAKFGGTGSPDNHDTANTLAGHFMAVFNGHARRDAVVAAISVRNYAVAAFVGNSVYMQMGYELCNQKQNSVFKGKTSPQDWQKLEAERGDGHALNISKRIRQINDLKKGLGVENCQAEIGNISEVAESRLIRMHVIYRDMKKNGKVQGEAVLFINKKPEDGAVRLDGAALQTFTEKGFSAEAAITEDAAINDVMILRKLPAQDKNIRLNKTGYSKDESHKI